MSSSSSGSFRIDRERLRRRVGGPWCCSWRVGLALVVLGLVFSSGWGASSSGLNFGRYLLVEVLGDAAGAVVLALAAMTVLRGRYQRPQPVLVVAGVWVVIGIVRGLVFAEFYSDHLSRLVNSAVSVPAWALVIIYVFATYAEGRSHAEQLAAANADLRAIQGSTEDLIEQERQRLTAAVQATVAAEIGRLRELVDDLRHPQADPGTAELADRVAAYSTDVIRETSRRLRLEEGALSPSVMPSSHDSVKPPGLLASYARARQPLLVPVGLIILKALTVSVLRWDPASFARECVAFALMVAVLSLGRALIERWMRRPSAAELVASTLLNLLAAVVLTAGPVVMRGDASGPAFVPWGAVGFFVFGVLVLARLVAGVGGRWAEVSADLEKVNAELAIANAELAAQLRLVQEQLADVLHGPVQGRLAAASMSLRMFVDARAEGRPADLAQVLTTTTTLLDRAQSDIEHLGQPADAHWLSVDAGIEQIAATWSGLLDVSWTVTDEWSRSPRAVDAIVDMAAELMTNASRHGNARGVDITVQGVDASRVEIRAVDDGVGPGGAPPVAGQGLGAVSRWDGRWSIERTPDARTRVVVRLSALR